MIRTLCVALPCLLVAPTKAADIIVSPGQSIQAAIDSAVAGDNVLIQPGVYSEAIDFAGKAIRVAGVSGPSVTTLDAAGIGMPAVRMQSGETADAILEGLTITNGVGQFLGGLGGGGGIHCANGAAPTIRRCRVTGNQAGAGVNAVGGGVAAISGASPRLEHCRIDNNQGDFGGGAGSLLGMITLRHCLVDNNSGISGGGVYGPLDAADCSFRSNQASSAGGGAYNDNASPFSLSRSDFVGNVAAANGGGVYYSRYLSATIIGCRFIDNIAALGGGLLLSSYSDSFFPSNVSVHHSVFAGNQASTGSALWIRSAAFAGGSGTMATAHCTIVGNGPAPAIHAEGTTSQIIAVRDSILRGNTPHFSGSPTPQVTHCDIEGGFAGVGNFDLDPAFILATPHDYHLQVGSPCRDAGSGPPTTGATDFEGDPRSGVVDVGADEFHPHLYLAGDPSPGGIVSLTIVDDPSPSPVLLFLGVSPLNPGIAAPPYGVLRVAPPFFQLVLPPSSTLTLTGAIPLTQPPSSTYLQAFSGTQLTNLATLDVW